MTEQIGTTVACLIGGIAVAAFNILVGYYLAFSSLSRKFRRVSRLEESVALLKKFNEAQERLDANVQAFKIQKHWVETLDAPAEELRSIVAAMSFGLASQIALASSAGALLFGTPATKRLASSRNDAVSKDWEENLEQCVDSIDRVIKACEKADFGEK